MPMVPIQKNDAEAGAAADGGRRPTVVAPASASPELSARPRRRTFTARDKLRILPRRRDRGDWCGPAPRGCLLIDAV
jgi:hypothetical protein